MGAFLSNKKVLFDLETASFVEAVAVIPEAKDREEFVKVYKLFSEKVLLDLSSLGYEAKVLLWLLAKTLEQPFQSEMWIPVSYGEVAKDIGLSEVSVKRYFKKLLELGYVEQFRRRQTIFRLRPEFVYKGVLVRYKESLPAIELAKRKREVRKTVAKKPEVVEKQTKSLKKNSKEV